MKWCHDSCGSCTAYVRTGATRNVTRVKTHKGLASMSASSLISDIDDSRTVRQTVTLSGHYAAWGQMALSQLPLTGPQQSARLLPVPPAWLVWPFGGRCGGAAGSKAISGDLGRRRGRLLCVDATR